MVYFCHLCIRIVDVKGHTVSADNPDCLVLFREYVSRNSASKGRAVLEGVGLNSTTIEACFNSHPLDEEGAVQAGLIRWSEGHSHKAPTWAVLLNAMEYAGLALQDIQGLEKELRHTAVCLRVFVHNHVCIRVRVYKYDSTCARTDFNDLPICMAKTHRSFSQEAHMKGAPKGFSLPVGCPSECGSWFTLLPDGHSVCPPSSLI